MKLYLNIFLTIVLFFPSSTCTRTEERTVDEDGTIKTVITDEEWETEERRYNGQGRGRGDTIIVMTNDNENTDQDQHAEVESEIEEPPPTSIEHNSVPLNRLYSAQLTDYHYSVDPQEQTTLNNVGYKSVVNLGRVFTKREHFPECPDLVPITRLFIEACTSHVLIVTSTTVRTWMKGWGWTNPEILGYGVLEKGKCGATLAVRQLAISGDCSSSVHITSDTERSSFLPRGYTDYEFVAPTFYIWDNTAKFEPPKRPYTRQTSLLTRLYNDKETDYHYSVAQKEQATLVQAGFQFDANMGRVVTKRSDMPDCPDLVSITRMNCDAPASTSHVLVVNAANVDQWKTWGCKDDRVIGYGVSEKGQCGATLPVRLLGVSGDPNYNFQTTSDGEINYYKRPFLVKYSDMSQAPIFYIWEA
jgi:hypothetical protein